MNETMTQIINAATPILCLLITAGGAYLVALLKRQTAQIEKDLDNETAAKYMNMAVDGRSLYSPDVHGLTESRGQIHQRKAARSLREVQEQDVGDPRRHNRGRPS